jgi:putative DNA primase/helicase
LERHPPGKENEGGMALKKSSIERPFDDDGKPIISNMVKIMLNQGIYLKYEDHWFSFNGKYYQKRTREQFEKLAQNLFGVTLTKHALAELMHQFELKVSVSSVDDNRSSFVNTLNGVVDYSTPSNPKLLRHSESHYFFNVLPLEFDTEFQCSLWQECLKKVLVNDDLILLVQEMFGYCLMHDCRFGVMFLLYGDGGNGKSVILTVLSHLLGFENTSALSFKDFGERFKLARLQNKLANISEESPTGKNIASDIFKNLVSGGEVEAEIKFKNPFKFKNKAKLIHACNHPPLIKDQSRAIVRRLVVIPFNVQIKDEEADRQLVSKLLEELPGIFNWSLEGLARLVQYNRFTESAVSSKASAQVLSESDSVRSFVENNCIFWDDAFVFCTEIFIKFREYCHKTGMPETNEAEFGKRLLKLFSEVKKGRESKGAVRRWYYSGIDFVCPSVHGF